MSDPVLKLNELRLSVTQLSTPKYINHALVFNSSGLAGIHQYP